MIENLKQFLNLKIEKNTISIKNYLPEDVNFNGDFEKIQSALLHLLENSIKSNGLIEISCAISRESNKFAIFVKDTGDGIDNPQKVSVPFYSTKKYWTISG